MNDRLTVKGLIAAGLLFGGASIANAAALTWDLNYYIEGGPPITSVASFGTVTISDYYNSGVDTGWVQVDVNLANDAQKLIELVFNFDPGTASVTWEPTQGQTKGYYWDTDPAVLGVRADEDNIKADGYKGLFDLYIPDGGNFGDFGDVTFLLKLEDGAGGWFNLSPDMFNFKDFDDGKGGNLLYLAAHIGNCGPTREDPKLSTCTPSLTGPDSIWVGASNGGIVPPDVIPEPGTLALFGIALAAMGVTRRRRLH